MSAPRKWCPYLWIAASLSSCDRDRNPKDLHCHLDDVTSSDELYITVLWEGPIKKYESLTEVE